MRFGVIIAAMLGLAAATAVSAWVGFGEVFTALARVGWRGFAVLVAYSTIPFCLLGGAWFVLVRHESPGRASTFIWARIVRDSAGELLPFSHLGGFVVGARAAIERGVSSTTAMSTTVVDVTTELIAQLGFIGIGLGLLAMRLGSGSSHENLQEAALIGLALTAAGAIAFIGLQRRGGGFIEALVGRFLPGAAAGANRVVVAIDELYHRPERIGLAIALHLTAWIVSAVGVWLALHLAGVEVKLSAVIAVESLVGAARSAAFFAPMGIGVQEASYALLGPLFGVGPEVSLAVSLLKRARDLAIGAPALLAWQGLEGVRLVKGDLGESGGGASPI